MNDQVNSPPSPPTLNTHGRYNQVSPSTTQPNHRSNIPASSTISHLSQISKDNRRKESNGGNGIRLFEKLSSVIYSPDSKSTNCLGSLVAGKKRDITSGTLYNLLATCLDSMPDGVAGTLSCQPYTPLFISKWIDYSNKYGFGYQLSDHSVGVFFNDLTRINISADKSRVEYHDCNGRLTVVSANSLPAWLQERYQLLRYFASYMDENLTEAGDKPSASPHTTSRSSNSSANSSTSSTSSTGSGGGGVTGGSSSSSKTLPLIPHIRRWDRTPKSIIMQLSNGTFQVCNL